MKIVAKYFAAGLAVGITTILIGYVSKRIEDKKSVVLARDILIDDEVVAKKGDKITVTKILVNKEEWLLGVFNDTLYVLTDGDIC